LRLGANDGIISTACLIVGVDAAAGTRAEILIAALAGCAAGATSMAAGGQLDLQHLRCGFRWLIALLMVGNGPSNWCNRTAVVTHGTANTSKGRPM